MAGWCVIIIQMEPSNLVKEAETQNRDNCVFAVIFFSCSTVATVELMFFSKKLEFLKVQTEQISFCYRDSLMLNMH